MFLPWGRVEPRVIGRFWVWDHRRHLTISASSERDYIELFNAVMVPPLRFLTWFRFPEYPPDLTGETAGDRQSWNALGEYRVLSSDDDFSEILIEHGIPAHPLDYPFTDGVFISGAPADRNVRRGELRRHRPQSDAELIAEFGPDSDAMYVTCTPSGKELVLRRIAELESRTGPSGV